MIRDSKGGVKLTRAELNELRKSNARYGYVVNDIRTDDEFHSALINALPPDIVDDMLEFFDTGSSPMTRKKLSEQSTKASRVTKESD